MKPAKSTILFAFMFCVLAIKGQAQNAVDNAAKIDTIKSSPAPPVSHIPYKPKPKPKFPKQIRRELSIGLRLNTDGWGVFVDRGAIRGENPKTSDMFYNVKTWQIEFDEKKNAREIKTSTDDQSSGGGKSNPYIFGKINNFYTFKVGLGGSKLIAGKPDPGTVAIHWVTSGGLSLGLLKPYYIIVDNGGGDKTIKYTDETHDNFLNEKNIVGGAGFSQGLSEIKFVPGVHLKTGLHFDFSGNRRTVFGVETGMNFEYYSQEIKLMALQPGVPYFYNLYVSIQFGKRWL